MVIDQSALVGKRRLYIRCFARDPPDIYTHDPPYETPTVHPFTHLPITAPKDPCSCTITF